SPAPPGSPQTQHGAVRPTTTRRSHRTVDLAGPPRRVRGLFASDGYDTGRSMDCTTDRWGGCLPRSHPPEVLEGPVHAGSDNGSADLLEVVTESLEHLVLQ